MARYYAKKRITRWSSVIIEANSEEEAHEISNSFDMEDGFIEDSSGEPEEFIEIAQDEFYDIPTLKQTIYGYEV